MKEKTLSILRRTARYLEIRRRMQVVKKEGGEVVSK
jgi:hypothetical protein